MGMQDKIRSKMDSIALKLYDERVRVSGNTMKTVRLSVTEDDFGDYTDVTIINTQLIEVEIDGLENLPLSRLRTDLTNGITPTTNLYLYDILPMKGRTKFVDNLQKDDILIHKINDEKDGTKAFFLTLQVVEVLGTPSPNRLIDIEFNLAPYTQPLDTSTAAEVLKEFDRVDDVIA